MVRVSSIDPLPQIRYRTYVLADPRLKFCPKCARVLAATAFNRASGGGLQGYCRECQSAWYREHRAQHIANVSANTARYRGRNSAFILEYLRTHPCVDCGESDPTVLEFDHVRGKTQAISTLRWRSASLELIQAEVERCDVRCVNCHFRRTAAQFGWRKSRSEDGLAPGLFEMRN